MANLMHFGGFLRKLTGNATAADVYPGKTFYNTDAKTKITGTMPKGTVSGSVGVGGTYTNTPNKYVTSVSVTGPTLSGNAGTGDVLSGKTFYSNSGTKQTGTIASRGGIGTTTLDAGGSKSFSAGYYNAAGSVSAKTPYSYDTTASADCNYSVTGLTVGAWYAFAIHSVYSAAWLSSGLTNQRSSSCRSYYVSDEDGTIENGTSLTLFVGKATNSTVTFATSHSAAGSTILCRRIG